MPPPFFSKISDAHSRASATWFAATNPIGALTGLPHGVACDQPKVRELISGLVAEGAASQQAVDDAREGMAAIEAAQTLAEARLQTNGVQLQKSLLRAPYDATVVARLVDEGRVAALD